MIDEEILNDYRKYDGCISIDELLKQRHQNLWRWDKRVYCSPEHCEGFQIPTKRSMTTGKINDRRKS